MVAQLVSIGVKTMTRYFPDIEYGDIEVVTPDRTPGPRLVADYVEFAKDMQRKTGKKMAFFQADVAWQSKGPVLPIMAMLKLGMHQAGVPVGDKTESAWTQTALKHLADLQRSPTTSVDQVIIHSWQSFPTHMLPEDEPGTLTFLLLRSEEMMLHHPIGGTSLAQPTHPYAFVSTRIFHATLPNLRRDV